MSTAPSRKSVRCAIYTRVSTDAGLDQEFNSLHAQYEGASAYIKSQFHAGWTLVRKRYDDGGFSGGSTDRPALQQLLTDVRTGRIDIIVVYKVDRLTRSLADFAKLVELFDAHSVSFVSVTQQFNTTTSMGRLTLNVLLSFAQFEREVTSERIRDKIAASKRKGLWVGGVVPLGYHAKDRKITIIESEAKTVRHIFKRYLDLGSLNLLLAELRSSGITTRVRPLSSGKTIGGIAFTRGPLAYLLRNRFYVGEVSYRGEVLNGEQQSIVDRKLFDAVQAKLDQQRSNHSQTRIASDALLMGRIYDDRGHLMTPTSTVKKGIRYRYYASSALIQGQKAQAGTISRVPADQIERLVVDAVRQHMNAKNDKKATSKDAQRSGVKAASVNSGDNDFIDDRSLIHSYISRIDLSREVVSVHVSTSAQKTNRSAEGLMTDRGSPREAIRNGRGKTAVLRISWAKRPTKAARKIIAPTVTNLPIDKRPIRSETRAKLVTAIAQGRRWLNDILERRVESAEQIAACEHCSVRQVNRAITLAFLSPRLVEAAVEGHLPRGVGVATIRHLPSEWSKQHAALGLKC